MNDIDATLARNAANATQLIERPAVKVAINDLDGQVRDTLRRPGMRPANKRNLMPSIHQFARKQRAVNDRPIDVSGGDDLHDSHDVQFPMT
jgi:hypothetical protein